jgi:hypothetical protein
MSSFCRLALLLALGLIAVTAAQAQNSGSSSNPAASTPDQSQSPAQAQPPAEQAAPQAEGQTQGQLSVQARIRARRAQRRAAAIHEAYAHLYEAYAGMGYLRFQPGSELQRAHEYAWDAGVTRFFDERLGVTVDARGYYGTAYVYNNSTTNSAITNPAISEYAYMAGPTYRFYLQPRYSISVRGLGGVARGIFSGDTNHSTVLSKSLGLWPDGYTFAASGSVPVEYNLTPHVGAHVAPEYFVSGFGSKTQGSFGFTVGIDFRFGKQ